MKAIFAWCHGFVLPSIDHMEVSTHFLDGWTKDVNIEMLNPLVDRKFILMPQVEGSNSHLAYKQHRGSK
jgi:hypothetical protein